MGATNREQPEYESQPVEAKARSVARLNRYRDLVVRRWWVLAAGLVAGTAIAWGLWWFRQPAYVSVGRMIVSIKLALPEGSVYSEELGNFLGTQAALMRSGVVLNRAQGRLAALDPTATAQAITLKVSVSPKTSIFVLETAGPEPQAAQAFLQACMEEYIKLKKEMRTQTSDTTVAGLTEEVLKLERDLRNCEEDLARFQRSNSVVLLQEQGNSLGSYVATLHQRLAALQAEDALVQSLGSGPEFTGLTDPARSSDLSQSAPEAASEAFRAADQPDSDVPRARRQILLLKAERQDLGRYLRPKHPKMVALSENIARREMVLGLLERQNAEELESRKASLGRQIAFLEQSLAEWNAKALDCRSKNG